MKKNLILSAILLVGSLIGQAQVVFRDGGWNEAVEAAKKENKYIFVDAFTDWCYWCKEMDKKTFSLQEVGEVMNASFIPVKIDMEKDFGVKLAMKFGVGSFPTFLVLNPDGRLVYTITGFEDGSKFIAGLKTSLEPQRSQGFQGISEKIDLEFPAFYTNSFIGNSSGKVSKPDEATVQAYLKQQTDLFSEINWHVMTRFIKLTPGFHDYIIENRDKYETLFGKEAVAAQIQNIIGVKFGEAAKAKDENSFQECIAMIDKYLDDQDGSIKSYYRITYYRETGQWIKMDKLIMEGINQNGLTDNLNELAWTIYEKCDDPVVIRDAIGWMRVVCEKNPSYAELDTYAALLYKNKEFAAAEKYASMAIEAGKKNNENVKETEALLVKIKTAAR